MSKRPLFSGRLATLFTMIGVSVGLGNVWRFPYMMGEYGGSAFLLIYLAFTLLFAIPAVVTEWGLGRSTRQGPVGAFRAMWGKQVGTLIGCMLLLTVLIAESYYIYVIANIAYSSGFSFIYGFNADQISNYQQGINDPYLQYMICLALLTLSYIVLVRGLKNGIESISRLFVPFFIVVMLFLIVFALQLDNAKEYLVNFLKPDFSEMTPSHIFAALGQAFFSLGLGGTFMLVFGSYLRPQDNLFELSVSTAAGDVGAALMAGLFIVPTVLALGLNMSEGPGLLFVTLPELFQRIPHGELVGALFLLALLTVTFISSIAALEVLLAGLSDLVHKRFTRKFLVVIICIVEACIILPIALKPSIIGLLDLIFGSGMQILGSMLALLAFTWGQSQKSMLIAVFGQLRTKRNHWHIIYYYWVKCCVPLVLFSVFIGYVTSKL